jgi:hypothetical protein
MRGAAWNAIRRTATTNTTTMKTIDKVIGRTISRSISLRILNDMTEDDSVRDAINAIPRVQRNRRIRKFMSLASKRGVQSAVIADFVAHLKN